MSLLTNTYFKVFFFLISCIFVFSSCDEEFVQSLSTAKPRVSLDIVNDLDSFYLGEPVEDIELVLEIINCPSISQIGFTGSFNSDYLQTRVDNPVIVDLNNENNLFYTENESLDIFVQPGASNSSFHVYMGFTDDPLYIDSTYTIGNGEIASFFLSGYNGETEININLDGVENYQQGNFFDLDEWIIDSPYIIGAPIPEIFLDPLTITYNNNRIKLDLYVQDLPKVTESEIIIGYDNSFGVLFNPTFSEEGPLLSSGYTLNFNEQDGLIEFNFNRSDFVQDTEVFVEGSGLLVSLYFDVNNINFESEISPLLINFDTRVKSAVFDVCGDCGADAPYDQYNEYLNLDFENTNSIWKVNQQTIQIPFGCTDSGSNLFNPGAIIDDGSCE